MSSAVREDQYTLIIIFLSVLLAIKMFQINFVEKIKTQILFSITFFSKIVLFVR